VARCDRGNRQVMVAERLQDIHFNRAQPCSTHAMAFRDPCHISARAPGTGALALLYFIGIYAILFS
jgi:hypothetical protein